jgi:hypothetical protein
MTEEQWRQSGSPSALLAEVLGHWRAQQRSPGKTFNQERLRLFAVACCRRIWDLLDEEHRASILVAERHAFTPCRNELLAARRKNTPRMKALHDEMIHASRQGEGHPDYLLATARHFACDAVWSATKLKVEETPDGILSAARAAGLCDLAGQLRTQGKRKLKLDWNTLGSAEQAVQADLVRDIFDNSFRPIILRPAWRTAQVVALATAADNERRLPDGRLELARLGVLGDALEEAGCTEDTVLEHLRNPAPHVRGCWAVSLVLGKE